MRSITDIFRPSVGNQKFPRYLIFVIKYREHIEMTSVTAGLVSADLDLSLFVNSLNALTSDHKDLLIISFGTL